jgi:chromosome segregation ATPase
MSIESILNLVFIFLTVLIAYLAYKHEVKKMKKESQDKKDAAVSNLAKSFDDFKAQFSVSQTNQENKDKEQTLLIEQLHSDLTNFKKEFYKRNEILGEKIVEMEKLIVEFKSKKNELDKSLTEVRAIVKSLENLPMQFENLKNSINKDLANLKELLETKMEVIQPKPRTRTRSKQGI